MKNSFEKQPKKPNRIKQWFLAHPRLHKAINIICTVGMWLSLALFAFILIFGFCWSCAHRGVDSDSNLASAFVTASAAESSSFYDVPLTYIGETSEVSFSSSSSPVWLTPSSPRVNTQGASVFGVADTTWGPTSAISSSPYVLTKMGTGSWFGWEGSLLLTVRCLYDGSVYSFQVSYPISAVRGSAIIFCGSPYYSEEDLYPNRWFLSNFDFTPSFGGSVVTYRVGPVIYQYLLTFDTVLNSTHFFAWNPSYDWADPSSSTVIDVQKEVMSRFEIAGSGSDPAPAPSYPESPLVLPQGQSAYTLAELDKEVTYTWVSPPSEANVWFDTLEGKNTDPESKSLLFFQSAPFIFTEDADPTNADAYWGRSLQWYGEATNLSSSVSEPISIPANSLVMTFGKSNSQSANDQGYLVASFQDGSLLGSLVVIVRTYQMSFNTTQLGSLMSLTSWDLISSMPVPLRTTSAGVALLQLSYAWLHDALVWSAFPGGYTTGYEAGEEAGYGRGMETGRQLGYDEGFAAGLAETDPFSVNKFVNMVDTFLDYEFFGFMSIGDLLIVAIAGALVMMFLKIFAGG